jgi:hypothetical protein
VEEVFNQGNLSLAGEFFSPDFAEREECLPGEPRHREGVKESAALFRVLPDFKAMMDDVIAEGDRVVIRQIWSGTHKGGFMGIPPTGMRVYFGMIDIVRSAGAGSWSIGARWLAWV